MQKKIKLIKILFLWLLLPILIIFFALQIYFIFNKYSNDQILFEEQVLRALIKGSQKVKKIWQEGDINRLWKSGKLKCSLELGDYKKTNFDDAYLRCNPNFIECFFSQKGNNIFEIFQDNKKFTILVKRSFNPIKRYSNKKRYYQIVTRANNSGKKVPNYAMMIELYAKEYPKKSLKVLLEGTCHDIYLPQRIYAYGPEQTRQDTNDWKWDNFGQTIFVDKYLVTFRDIIEWSDYGNDSEAKLISITDDRNLWSRPATGLNIEQMKRFCAFRGKKMMEAHVYDAASFFPGDFSNPKPSKIIRPPYPWSKKRKKSFLHKAQTIPDFEFKKSFCQKIYTKECITQAEFRGYSNYSGTWSGMSQVLGGYLEAVVNIIEPLNNLKASSFYFNLDSRWHKLGERAYWDGAGWESVNFDWSSKDKKGVPNFNGTFKVGFRCMRTVLSE